jgi:hypothetical protein
MTAMVTSPFVALLLLANAAPSAGGLPQVHEIRVQEVVDLLSGLSMVYESTPTWRGFTLRAFVYPTEGECDGKTCPNDRPLFARGVHLDPQRCRDLRWILGQPYRNEAIRGGVPSRQTLTLAPA